ncbi:MAG: CocE/NonD family hydrolase [Bacteroidota bacterium]|nr:CocE/NonD family hydrolase [Bacteroidota bacterium]
MRLAGFILRRITRKIFKTSLQKIPGLNQWKDVGIPMRDGIRLLANIYLPDEPGNYPVIMSMTPYGKDQQPERYEIFKIFGIDVGTIDTSDLAIFEGPDPAFWVKRGYAVIHANARGMWNSEGMAYVFDKQNGLDYYDLIEWAAGQPWSNGKVGLNGVSYLAWSQWMAASLQPPHLTAICPWEGFTDMYRDAVYHGGIREIGLIGQLTSKRFSHYNRKYGLIDDLLKTSARHPLDDEYWQNKCPDLTKITVPALVCASWSDQGLHTRGSFEGYKQIGSEHKWLYTHGRRKWETYYGNDALEWQETFFNCFLKGENNDMHSRPTVRLEVRTAYYTSLIRYTDQWPLSQIVHQKLFLHAPGGDLLDTFPQQEGYVRYAAMGKKGANRAAFTHVFKEDTELTGGMNLHLWVSAEDSNDMDLFVVVKKLDSQGKEVYFSGYNGGSRDVVAKGWLRVSHRELDPSRSTVEMPYHRHKHLLKITPNEIVPVQVEIWPSSTFFEKGSALQLIVMGQEPIEYNTLKHENRMNRGFHRVYSGGRFASYLLIPRHPTDESAIRALADRFVAAFNAGDIDGMMKNYVPGKELFVFDVVPRDQHAGADAYRRDWEEFFAVFKGTPKISISELAITVEGNLGFSHSIQRVTGIDKQGHPVDRLVRVTDGYRKIAGTWLIALEHISVPVDLKTGRIATH